METAAYESETTYLRLWRRVNAAVVEAGEPEVKLGEFDDGLVTESSIGSLSAVLSPDNPKAVEVIAQHIRASRGAK